MAEMKLPASKKLWPEAAERYREQLAAVRRLKVEEQMEKHVVQMIRLHRNLAYEVIEAQEEERQGEQERETAAQLKSAEEEPDAGDTDWTTEEVQLLWQGKTVKRTERKAPKKPAFDQRLRWSPRQQLRLHLMEKIREELERPPLPPWRDDKPATRFPRARVEHPILTPEDTRRARAAEVEELAMKEEQEESEEDLPTFGFKSYHKQRQLSRRVRPVWLPDAAPLHCDSGLPKELIRASAAFAPPTSDEVRRLVYYPEEVRRREIEDGVVFEAAGELMRRKYRRKWDKYRQQLYQEHERRRSFEETVDRQRRNRRERAVRSELRKRTYDAAYPTEEEECQGEANSAFEESLGQSVYRSGIDVGSDRRRLASQTEWRRAQSGKVEGGRVSHSFRKDMEEADAAAFTTAPPPPPPPPWLIDPGEHVLSFPPHRDYTRPAAMLSSTAERAEEESREASADQGTKRTRGNTGAGGRSISATKSSSTPGGPLDKELIVVSGPKRGWLWTIEDHNRWRRSLLLRRAMKNNQLLFAADLEERQYAEDYERFMGKPFKPPRADWGGYAYYAAVEDDEKDFENQGEGRVRSKRRSEPGDGSRRRRKSTSGKSGAALVREEAWREAFDAYVQEHKQREEAAQQRAMILKQSGEVTCKL